MKASITMLGTAAVAVGIVVVQAAPVLIKNAPQLSLDGLPPVADVTLYPRRQDRLESRTSLTGLTGLTALEKTTNDVANRIYSSATFDRGPSLQSKLGIEADKMGEPMGLPKTPKVHGWSEEEMEPFRATPYSVSAHQVHAPSEASASSLEAQISHELELSLAPKRTVSFRDSASQPSSPAHRALDQGKHEASLVPPSPKQPSFKKSASPSSPVHKDEVEKEHSLDSHLLTGLAHGEHSESSSGAGVFTFRNGKRVYHEDKRLFRHVFTQKEEEEIEELRLGLRNLQAAELEWVEKMPNQKKWWWTRSAKDAKLAKAKFHEASNQYSVIFNGKSKRLQEEAMDREALAEHFRLTGRD